MKLNNGKDKNFNKKCSVSNINVQLSSKMKKRRAPSPIDVSNQASTSGSGEKHFPSYWPVYSLVSTVALVCYLNGLGGDFVHDDIPAVTLNKDVLGQNPIINVFKNDFWGTPMADLWSHKSYRPLTVLTFRANYYFFSLQPFWFHITNVTLHVVACVLFTRVSLCVAGLKPPFATIAGLMFATHPIHTEAVTGIVGRADVLACVFFLLSLLAYHGDSENRYFWTSVIFGGLSLLAKETGITIFPLNLVFDFYLSWPHIKEAIQEGKWSKETRQLTNRSVKILTSLGVFLAARLALLQGSLPKFSPQDNPTAFHPSFFVRFLTFCYLAAFNWWLLLCPATLSHDWQMGSVPLITSLADERNLVTFLFFACAFLLAVRSVMDFEHQKHCPLVLGLLLLVVPFIPATNLLVTVGFVVAERVLYIPSLGCILLIVYGIKLLWSTYPRNRSTINGLIALLIVTSSLRTVVRNRDWRSRESLLRSGLSTLPHNAKMHYNYANFLRDSSRSELAQTHYNKALKLWPTYASAYNNLGTLITNESEAERHFLSAIHFSADHVNAHYNLGQLYRKLNRTSEASYMLKRCIKLDPTFTLAYLELARLKGSSDLSVGPLLEQVVSINAEDSYYILLYAHWLLSKGRRHSALIYYSKALSVDSSYQPALLGTLRVLKKLGQNSRLFRLQNRYFSLNRQRRGQIQFPHTFLEDLQIKSELIEKARLYDNHVNNTKKGGHYPITTSTKYSSSATSFCKKCDKKDPTETTNSLNKISKTNLTEHKSSAPWILQHIPGTV